MKTLTTKQLDEMAHDQDLAIINVLSESAFHEQHIPGSHSVPLDDGDFERRVERLAGDKMNPVVVYCASTECDASERAARKLQDAGFSDVYDYEGGMKAWREAGLEVQSGAAVR